MGRRKELTLAVVDGGEVEVGGSETPATRDLAAEFIAFLDETGLSQNQAAKEVGYSGTALSRYCKGAYPGNQEPIEAAIAAFLDKRRRKQKVAPEISLVHTDAFTEIVGGLNEAHYTDEMACITGKPGCGKTISGHFFDTSHANATFYAARDGWQSPTGLGRQLLFRAAAPKKMPQNLDVIEQALIDHYKQHPTHIIIGDAQCLGFRAVNMLCCINEEAGVPVSLTGHEILLQILRDPIVRDAELWDRIKRRVSFTQAFNPFDPARIAAERLNDKQWRDCLDKSRVDCEAIVKQIIPDIRPDGIDAFCDEKLQLSWGEIASAAKKARMYQLRTKHRKADAELIKAAIAKILPPAYAGPYRHPANQKRR